MKKRKLIILDPGHGGIDPKTEEYTTAPNKMAWHDGYFMHHEGWFYEGVWNRFFALLVGEMLAGSGLPFVYTIPAEQWHEDVSLGQRVAYVNAMAQCHEVLLISIHANAFDGSVRGWQVHTSPGETASDYYAEALHRHVGDEFGNMIVMRSDTSDGDMDYENKFQMLTRTSPSAILAENLFFDNVQDAKLLMDDHFCERLARCYFRVAVRFMVRG